MSKKHGNTTSTRLCWLQVQTCLKSLGWIIHNPRVTIQQGYYSIKLPWHPAILFRKHSETFRNIQQTSKTFKKLPNTCPKKQKNAQNIQENSTSILASKFQIIPKKKIQIIPTKIPNHSKKSKSFQKVRNRNFRNIQTCSKSFQTNPKHITLMS